MQPSYALGDHDLLAQCDATSSSTHSPGGQHRNKAESAVRLRHKPSGLMAQCEANRDRADNRAEALCRLRLRLVLADPGRSDRSWLSAHIVDQRFTIGRAHPRFALVVACALDALTAARGQLPEAAADLGVTSSQLARVLVTDKEVHQAANRIRAGHALPAIKGG